METTEKRVHQELSEHAGREESGHGGVCTHATFQE